MHTNTVWGLQCKSACHCENEQQIGCMGTQAEAFDVCLFAMKMHSDW